MVIAGKVTISHYEDEPSMLQFDEITLNVLETLMSYVSISVIPVLVVFL